MSAGDSAVSDSTRSGFVALLGWTNVGKSTLLNRIVGTKLAAVADVPQTTRTRIMGVRTLPGRGQVVFIDTPGLHRPRFKMNRGMVATAKQATRGIDLAALVVDAARGAGAGDAEASVLVRRAGVPCIGILNKIDLVRPKSRLLPLMRTLVEEWKLQEAIPVSALSGEGCEELLDRLVALLPPRPFPFSEETLTDQPERVLAAEWIREKLLAETRQELPHATAVVVESWREREDGLLEIRAVILVERSSQKKIVIGHGGSLLKRVGTAAREDLERFLNRRIVLRLWVTVRHDWRNDSRALRELGLR